MYASLEVLHLPDKLELFLLSMFLQSSAFYINLVW